MCVALPGKVIEIDKKRGLLMFNYYHTFPTCPHCLEPNFKGISIIPYEKKYMLKLLDFLLDEFGAGWKRNAFMAMQHHEAEKVILMVVDQNEEILGFCMRKIDGNEGRFGPFGVSEKLRSTGIGGALFEYMMKDMKSRGIPYLYFLWTGGPAKRFYERHGVKVYRTYKLFRKELV